MEKTQINDPFLKVFSTDQDKKMNVTEETKV